jgi:hypothetical protein
MTPMETGTGRTRKCDDERIVSAARAPYVHVLNGSVELQRHTQQPYGSSNPSPLTDSGNLTAKCDVFGLANIDANAYFAGSSSDFFSTMPSTFDFCLPTKATTVPDTQDWLHEVKYDGCRLRLKRDGDRVRLITGNQLDRSTWIVEAALKNRHKQFVSQPVDCLDN